MRIRLLALFALVLTLIACGGGGGGGGNVSLSGRVLNIDTGAPFPSAATVQTTAGNASAAISDGSFLVPAPKGATSLSVIAPASFAFPIFDFTFDPQNQPVNDVGDLWVGPQKVTVRGTLRNASSGVGVSGAKVQFAGVKGTSGSDGTFSLTNVAYSSGNTASFLGLVGRVDATNFFTNEFTAGGNTAVAGVVDVGDIILTPLDSTNPPGLPFTIWGIISPSASAPGTIVTLKNLSNVVLRRFTVGTDARYQFWIEPGTYRLEFQNGTLTAPAQNVTLVNTNDVIRADATLS